VIVELAKKYKWTLFGIVCVYVVVALWLFFATDSPQEVPFEYQVR
jgi:hypothetical protein